MFPRMSSRSRFSNRQVIAFFTAIAVGLLVGWLRNAAVGGMMAGAVVGALAMLLLAPKGHGPDGPPDSSPDPTNNA